MEALQLERLQQTVARVWENVPFYRRKMEELGVRPEHIKSVKDVSLLPLTVKNDLRDNYPYGLFASPQRSIVRFHASSGTTGKPIVVGYTRNDMEVWTDCCARVASAAGIGQDDVCQIAFGYGMFTGGFGMHYGIERVGATVVPASAAIQNAS
jgi:phenylacetate-CoA ligase